MQDADALDLLHRLDALAHDALDAVEQLAAEQRVARLIGKHVLGLVEQLLRLGLDRRAHAFGLGGNARLLGFLLGDQHLDGLAPLGDLAVAHGDDAFGRLGRPRLGVFGLGLRGRLFQRLLIENDRLLHQRRLDLLLAVDLQLAQSRARGRCGPRRGPRSEAMRARCTSSFAAISASCNAWTRRDFELLDHAPALQPGRFQRLLPRYFGGLDIAAGDDLGLLDLPVGVDALRALRR